MRRNSRKGGLKFRFIERMATLEELKAARIVQPWRGREAASFKNGGWGQGCIPQAAKGSCKTGEFRVVIPPLRVLRSASVMLDFTRNTAR